MAQGIVKWNGKHSTAIHVKWSDPNIRVSVSPEVKDNYIMISGNNRHEMSVENKNFNRNLSS